MSETLLHFLQREEKEITTFSFKEFIQYSPSLDKIYYLVFEITWANKLRWHYPSAVLNVLYVSWWFEYDYNSWKKVFRFMLTNKIVPSKSFEWGTLKCNLYQKANPSDFMGIKARLICIIYKNIPIFKSEEPFTLAYIGNVLLKLESQGLKKQANLSCCKFWPKQKQSNQQKSWENKLWWNFQAINLFLWQSNRPSRWGRRRWHNISWSKKTFLILSCTAEIN